MFKSSDVQYILKYFSNPEESEQPEQKGKRNGHLPGTFLNENIVQGLTPSNFMVIDTVCKECREAHNKCKCSKQTVSTPRQ